METKVFTGAGAARLARALEAVYSGFSARIEDKAAAQKPRMKQV